MVAYRHRLAAYRNKHCWRAFRGYQHRWPWTTLNPQNMVLSDFFCYFWLRRTLRVNFSLKYTGDWPRLPKYEIKLMLWRVSWALAQISCYFCDTFVRCYLILPILGRNIPQGIWNKHVYCVHSQPHLFYMFVLYLVKTSNGLCGIQHRYQVST